MPIADRHLAARARRTGVRAAAEPPQEYKISHPDAQPDARGEFAGQKTYWRGGEQFVRLTAAQARFYLDQDALTPTVTPGVAT